MIAVLFRLRTEARTTLRGFATLALMLGLAGGVVLTAWSGARRTDGAYPAFLKSAHAADADIGVEELNGKEVPFLDKVEQLPQVADHTRRAYVFIVPAKPNGEADPTSPLLGQSLVAVDSQLWHTIDTERIIAGRAADPNNPTEITIGRYLANRYHIEIGHQIPVASFTPAESEQVLTGSDFVPPTGPRVTLRVVGVEVAPGELAAASFDNTPVHLTPAFFRMYQGKIGMSQATRVRLRHGAADLPALRHEVDQLVSGGRLTVTDQPGLTAKVQRSIHLQATSLRLFAVLAGLAAFVIVSQALVRQLLLSADEYTVLRGIGMTRGQLASLAWLRAGLVGAVGAAIAVFVNVLASPLTPVGLARVVESHAGVRVDVPVLALGALGMIVAVLLVAAWPAWWSTRRAATTTGSPLASGGRSRFAEALGRAGAPPWLVTGTRLALEPGAGRTAVPVRSTIAGATLAVAALVSAASFGTSLTHLMDTPRLYGWGWQLAVGNPYAYNIEDEVVPALVKNPAVAEVAALATAPVTVNGRALTAIGVKHIRGTLEPTLVSGATPVEPDEVTLGAKTMRALHVHRGDVVTVHSTGGSHRMKVVGAAVYPSVGVDDPGGVGEGVGMTLEAMRVVAPDAPANVFPFNLRAGVDVATARSRLRQEFRVGQVDVLAPQRPTDIDNYESVRWVPALLATILGFLAMGTLANTLVSSVRRRRRDIALLKTLGFVRGQIRAAVGWQASVLAAIALAIGLPVGVAVGRWMWRLYALQQGVAPEPVAPLLILVLIVPVMLLIANLIASAPAASAARTRPATILRAE